ncbi:MAG: hypothetical protein R3F07_04670 [Opitutaceae bacterium]
MKSPIKSIVAAAGLLLVHGAPAQTTGTVISVKDRTDTLELADQLLSTKPNTFAEAIAVARDPFEVMMAQAVVSDMPVETVAAAPRYNDRQILEAIGPRVDPTGSVRIGDTDYLLFGQKRLKVGEKLTITYEGSVYAVEITSIERNNFRIRLNSEELVRPIK